jgi:Josephin
VRVRQCRRAHLLRLVSHSPVCFALRWLAWPFRVFSLWSGCALVSLGASYRKEDAFVCHFESHWFTVRKVRGHWTNLNSLQDQPTWLSPLYLSVFLRTLEAQNYTIFAVRGLSACIDALRASASGRWEQNAMRCVERPSLSCLHPLLVCLCSHLCEGVSGVPLSLSLSSRVARGSLPPCLTLYTR